MKTIALLLILLISLLNSGDIKTQCIAYDPSQFNLKLLNYTNDHTEDLNLESLKIYYTHSKESPYPITVGYTIDGHEYFTTDVYCSIQEEQNYVWCGVECDGGGFQLGKGFRIKTDQIALYRTPPNEETGIEKVLFQKQKGTWIEGKAFACPEKIPASEAVDRKYYQDDPLGHYVCYGYKHEGKYEECFRTTRSCRALHLQHFGKYLSTKESAKALKRCQTSTPNRDYVDDKKGRYVCYDYKDTLGEYSGCFRSQKSCAVLKKEHFGRYPNINESRKALERCRRSIPRK